MEVVKTITSQPWMTAAPAQSLMTLLNSGTGPMALFVGGCVRNTLLEKEVSDIDIATRWTPQEVIEKLEASGMKAIPTGLDHGTVTAVVDNMTFEITTLRHDVETDGRHAKVEFTEDWLEDARRRDFTMNTLLADQNGNIYDPTGQGLKDLDERRVVFVGNPAQRIEEDYLRILRFFRFHAYYGAGEPDQEALKACAAAAKKIKTLSKERITQEFFKILLSDNFPETLELMKKHNILPDLINLNESILSQGRALCKAKGGAQPVLATRLVLLINRDLKNLDMLEGYLILPKKLQGEVKSIISLSNEELDTEKAVKVALYKYGREITQQTLLLNYAVAPHEKGFFNAAIDLTKNWEIPTFPITGEDLKKQGFEAGPELGEELKRREQEWIENDFILKD